MSIGCRGAGRGIAGVPAPRRPISEIGFWRRAPRLLQFRQPARVHVVGNGDMMRLFRAFPLWSLPFLVWSCAGSPEDDRSEEVIERAAFLFRHYGEAQKRQD